MLQSLSDRLADERYRGVRRLRLVALLADDLIRSVYRQWRQRRAMAASGSGFWSRAGWCGDLKFGVRLLYRDPGTTVLATAAFGLGIGLSTVAFAVFNGTVLRGMPFERAAELVHFGRANRPAGIESLAVTPHDFVAWRERQSSFLDLAAYVEALFVFDDEDGYPREYWGQAISARAFPLLGVEPIIGRLFTETEDVPGGPNVVLIGHQMWQQRFGGDSQVVGSTIRVNGVATTVLAVMPPEFSFPVTEQLWRPLQLDIGVHSRGSGRLDVFGRLRPGTSIDKARADFGGIAASLAAEFPAANNGIEARLRSFTEEYVGPEFTARVWTMLLAACLVLALSCLNVTSLLLARATSRAGEMAVRSALGAGRARIGRQLLIESSLLALLGGVFGIALAGIGLQLFATYWAGSTVFALPHGPEAPSWWQFQIDGRALAFSLGLTGLAALISGVAPLGHLRGGDLQVVLKGQRAATPGRSRVKWGSVLVIVEMALCTTLIICAGLVVRSYAQLQSVGDGLDLDDVYTLGVSLWSATVFDGSPGRAPTEHVYADRADRVELWQRLDMELGRQPEVVAHALASVLPAAGSPRTRFSLPSTDPAGELPRARYAVVTPSFFPLLSVEPISGRLFNGGDGPGAEPVVVVNATFASRFFANGSALNQSVRLGDADSTSPWLRIIGVVPDLWMDGVRNRDPWGLYLTMAQAHLAPAPARMQFVRALVRTPGSARGVEIAVRRAVAGLDERAPVSAVQPLAATVAAGTGRYRVHGSFYLFLGLVAVILAALGLYGVLAQTVSMRRAEIGTRMALGAVPASVVRMVLNRALLQVGIGALFGLLLAAWLQPQLEQILYQVAPWDPLVLVGLLAVLAGVAGVASFVPARRAARVDPLEAMRAN